MKYLLIVLIVCLAVFSNKVRSNENDDASQNELDNIQKEELDAIDENAEDRHDHGLLNCNFENGTCEWVNDNSDNFDWTRHRGSTSSSVTGPSGDHTPGLNGNGWYVYTETSSPRQQGDVARLVSSIYLLPGTFCLNFWYHMYGSSMGRLDVLIIPLRRNRSPSMWSASGNHGNRWINGKVSLTSNTYFKIVFQGTRGSSYTGDMALDDITVSPGKCTAPPSILDLNCNFENGTCGWVNDRSDNFDWTRHRGSTPSYQTGPSGDHTPGLNGNGSGWYVYTETSSGQQGDVARLVSSINLSPGTYCLDFWYHMYGSSMGRLDVLAGHDNSSRLWSTSGNHGNRWLNGKVTFTRHSSFKIVFQGTKGSSYQGDMALDDITVSRGNCAGPTTAPPRPTTSSPCYCYNGGYLRYCRGGHVLCYCYRGYYGDQCQYAPNNSTSTAGPTTSYEPPSTVRPSITCYLCSQASSPHQCLRRTTTCYGSGSVCMHGRYTLKSSGRSYYIAGCGKSLNYCQSLCRNALKQGIVTYCSISCCQRDYCNRIALSTTRRPPKTHTPNINSRFFLRLILKLLKSFKALIDVTSALLKAHLKSKDAQFQKREIVSMMKRVDYNAQHLENSRDPEAIKVKRDVDETRMRAKDLIAKLDDCIDDEPEKNKT